MDRRSLRVRALGHKNVSTAAEPGMRASWEGLGFRVEG